MTIRTTLIATLALVSFSSAVYAQDAEQPKTRGACRDDIQKLCAGIERGGGRIRECLTGQMDKLSDTCKQRIESRPKKSQ